MYRKNFVLAICMAGIVGCAFGNVKFTGYSDSYNFEIQKTVPVSIDQFWEIYKEALLRFIDAENINKPGTFSRKSIKKEEYVINISLDSDTPSEYIDCGKSLHTSIYPFIKTATKEYEIADSTEAYEGVDFKTNVPSTIERKTDLSSTNIEISMIPKGSQTQLRVFVKYKLTVETTINTPGNVGEPYKKTSEFFGDSSKAVSNGKNLCLSKGILEKRLLSLDDWV